MIISVLAAFSVKSNLLYFVPKDPGRSRIYVSNTIWIVLCTSTFACVTLFIFREPILSNASFNLLIPLSVYVLLFTNLDFLESYWVAKKQPNNVFYYSVCRTIVRLSAVLATAAFSPTVDALVRTLIAVEAIRILAVVLIMRRINLRLEFIDRPAIHSQLTFVVPLGFASSLHYLNEYVGQIAISTHLGVVALAIYTIGSYQVPILDIVRGSIVDSIFPDMVRQASGDGRDKLHLWKRSIVAYTSVILPVIVLLFFYADVLIPFVFTEQYVSAVPIFRILVAVAVIQCFEFSTPLRAINRNKILLLGNVIMLGVNVGIILTTFRFFAPYAIYGPAVGIVTAYVVQHLILGIAILRIYSVRAGDFLKWRSLAVIFISAALSCIPLGVGEQIDIPEYVRLPVFSLLFAVSYFLLIRWAKVEEVETLIQALSRKVRPT
jgi:O-antigen/teichoic acid export membrane protein